MSSPEHHQFLDPDEWQAWNALLLLHRKVIGELDATMRQHHGLGTNEFDVLITLFNAEGRRLGMSALAASVLLSPPGITHLVTRLEGAGLLRREADPRDGRKGYAVLTGDGEDALRAARVTHNEVLRQGFLAATTRSEREVLRRVWRRLAESAPPGGLP